MPFKSEKQRRALYAAASGHSTLGISQSGARKFIEHSGHMPPKMKRTHKPRSRLAQQARMK